MKSKQITCAVQARGLAKDMLSEARFYHTECVAKAAETLAQRYGEDVEHAKIAAYLHDILKEYSRADLLQRLQASAIIDVAEISKSPAIWHAFAGGLYVKDELGLDDEIADAVMHHTTGRVGMTKLEQIIFVADYISEDRDFRGVPEVRALAETSLDEACIAALRNSIVHLSKNLKHVDVNSVRAFNALVDKRSEDNGR